MESRVLPGGRGYHPACQTAQCSERTEVAYFWEGSHRVNMGDPMTKEEAYVENAVESLELAERLASSTDRRSR